MRMLVVLAGIYMFGSTGALGDEGLSAILVNVSGAIPGKGQVIVTLFDSDESYMAEPTFEAVGAIGTDGSVSVDLGAHVPGSYAVVVVYDENSDGELNTGLFGIPKEKIGFSNNAKGKFGPAKWKDAQFDLPTTDLQIDVQLKAAKPRK